VWKLVKATEGDSMGTRKTQREAIARAVKEAAVYGCTIEVGKLDGRNHLRLIIRNPRTGAWTVHTVGGSPKSADAMVDGVGNQVRRKARALVGLGPTG
jgi:hypothetical protein